MDPSDVAYTGDEIFASYIGIFGQKPTEIKIPKNEPIPYEPINLSHGSCHGFSSRCLVFLQVYFPGNGGFTFHTQRRSSPLRCFLVVTSFQPHGLCSVAVWHSVGRNAVDLRKSAGRVHVAWWKILGVKFAPPLPEENPTNQWERFHLRESLREKSQKTPFDEHPLIIGKEPLLLENHVNHIITSRFRAEKLLKQKGFLSPVPISFTWIFCSYLSPGVWKLPGLQNHGCLSKGFPLVPCRLLLRGSAWMDLSILTFDFIHMVTGSRNRSGTVGRSVNELPTGRDFWGCYVFEGF